MHAIEVPPTASLPSSRSNPSSHVRLFCLLFFCSTLTHTALMHTVSSRVQSQPLHGRYRSHFCFLCTAYRPWKSFMGIGQWCRAQCRKPQYFACILRLFPLLLVTWALHCNYIKINKSYALIALRMKKDKCEEVHQFQFLTLCSLFKGWRKEMETWKKTKEGGGMWRERIKNKGERTEGRITWHWPKNY